MMTKKQFYIMVCYLYVYFAGAIVGVKLLIYPEWSWSFTLAPVWMPLTLFGVCTAICLICYHFTMRGMRGGR